MSQQPVDYFLSALESQRSINTHIHEIEPSTPVVLYEIDLNEIKPGTISYQQLKTGPVKDGILRIHNDFNLFNLNRGVIKWRNNFYYPFPVYGEQFDITSNGTIPTPKLKFSSQYLDDEFNSFYKYIRMQINELKDIVGAKVTRRKTFVRYLHPDNFPGNVNPFNEFIDAPWASRDGDTLTVKSTYPIDPPAGMSKWLVYYFKPNYGSTSKVFTTLFTDDRLRTLNIQSQQQNYAIESTDFFSLLINNSINTNSLLSNGYFAVDSFVISGNNSRLSRIIPEPQYEYTELNSSNKSEILCSSSNFISNTNSFNAIIRYPITFPEPAANIASFISIKSNVDSKGVNTNYSITNQFDTGLHISFSNPISGNYNLDYLSLRTGYYTGVNPYSQEDTKLAVLKIANDFSTQTAGSLNITFPFQFSTSPKILFNGWGNSGFFYNQFISNISSTGLTINITQTGSPSRSLNVQNFNILATDYIHDDFAPTGSAQIFSSQSNLAIGSDLLIESRNIMSYETELTPDIFYIDRKVQEDSTNVIYELASLLDIEGVRLPSRLLLSKNCSFAYRGEGCVYEYSNRLSLIHSGIYGEVKRECVATDGSFTEKLLNSSQKTIGLKAAPPVADDSNNIFTGVNQSNWIDRGAWNFNIPYKRNNFIFIEKNLIKYYFVCIRDHVSTSINAPPDQNFWLSDSCSKTLDGCRLRWSKNPNFPALNITGTFSFSGYSHTEGKFIQSSETLINFPTIKAPKDANNTQLVGILPFGGFPSVEGRFQNQQSPGV